jgi:hypothetical protein
MASNREIRERRIGRTGPRRAADADGLLAGVAASGAPSAAAILLSGTAYSLLGACVAPLGSGHTAAGRTSIARAAPAWIPLHAGFRVKIKENWHSGELCASREAAVKLKTILWWALVAFLIWWIIQQPVNAAHLVHNIGTLLTTAARGFSHFVSSL